MIISTNCLSLPFRFDIILMYVLKTIYILYTSRGHLLSLHLFDNIVDLRRGIFTLKSTEEVAWRFYIVQIITRLEDTDTPDTQQHLMSK